MAHAPLRSSGGSANFVSQSSTPDTEPLSMMLAFDVRPTNKSIRKGLKQHPIRGSHNDCQRCKVSKCLLADIARRTTSFKGMSALPRIADICAPKRDVHFGSIADVAYSLRWPKKGPPFAKELAARLCDRWKTGGWGPAIRISTRIKSVGSLAIARMGPC